MLNGAKKRQGVFPLIVLVILIIAGCAPNSQLSPLKSPFLVIDTPYKLSKLPHPAPGTSVIVGVLKLEHTNQPMVSVELYLAQHIGITQDAPIYKLDLDNAPRAITRNDGSFVFEEVPPGRYAIVIWSPFNSFLARNPATGSELVIDVEPDRIYDIGTLYERYP
jgi:hypothetical protein